MKIRQFYVVAILSIAGIIFNSFIDRHSAKIQMPYRQAGLTAEEAATHLLNRFTYGPKPGQVEVLVKQGLEKWFKQQLEGEQKDKELDSLLSKYDAINLSNAEVENIFPRGSQVTNRAIKDGYLNKDSVNANDRKMYRETINTYMKSKGYRPQQELYRQFINQKILRATYSNNQLREMMTDFWFNHFNVSMDKNQCASFVPAYERDVIRPNVLGHFDQLLLATAKSPAMLMYLDNFSSSGTNNPINNDMGMATFKDKIKAKAQTKKKGAGLNENYAREVMELHTLGVDGGYSQSDVTQAAKILTGWTVAPLGEDGYGSGMRKLISTIGEENLEKRGFVKDGDFFFAMNRHDNNEKTVMGKKFPAGGGYQEGVGLLEMLAHHSSTANFIAKKIAVRFVSDNPPKSLIAKMAKTFLATDGDIKSVLITMVNAPEFWSKTVLGGKTKSPFELAISSVRALDADIIQPYQIYSWVNKMGQQMYYYQAPTGFPDRGQYWINTGSLLNRMNFGLAIASQRIPGITFNLKELNDNHEPESAEAALSIYGKLLMPERDLTKTVARLKPLLSTQGLENKVATAAEKTSPTTLQANLTMNDTGNMMNQDGVKGKKALIRSEPSQVQGNNSMLAQVVGVIIGSPEFQRK